jgi:hypothetical protein
VKGDCLRRSPSAWLSVFSTTLVLLSGCGGDGDSQESQRLDRAVAERLAQQSDAVADAIEANDGCEAERRVEALRSSLQAASVPTTVRREIERFANRTFTCVPVAPPPPPAAVSTEEDDDDQGKGKGHKKQKKGKKHGHDDEGED